MSRCVFVPGGKVQRPEVRRQIRPRQKLLRLHHHQHQSRCQRDSFKDRLFVAGNNGLAYLLFYYFIYLLFIYLFILAYFIFICDEEK